MDKVLDGLNLPWVGTLLGIIGILLTVVFYLLQWRGKRLHRAIASNKVIAVKADADPHLEVRYMGIPVPRVSNSSIAIWNSGTETILGKDIVEGDPLRVQVAKNCSIFQANFIYISRAVIAPNIDPVKGQSNVANITFDFLDPGDNVVLNVIHSDGVNGLSIAGVVRGLPHGLQVVAKQQKGSRLRRLLPAEFFWVAALTAVCFMIYEKTADSNPIVSGVAIAVIVVAIAASSLGPPLHQIIQTRRAPPAVRPIIAREQLSQNPLWLGE